jgi:hypothetical protein
LDDYDDSIIDSTFIKRQRSYGKVTNERSVMDKSMRDMGDKIWDALDALADYDSTLESALSAVDVIGADSKCDPDTMALAEGLLVSVLLDKVASLLPEDKQAQEEIAKQALGLEEVFSSLEDPAPLVYQVAIAYAVALSQGHNQWRPWDRVRDILLAQEAPKE